MSNLITKVDDTHFEVGQFTVRLPAQSKLWELTGPQMEPVMAEDRYTLLLMATRCEELRYGSDLVRELIILEAKENIARDIS